MKKALLLCLLIAATIINAQPASTFSLMTSLSSVHGLEKSEVHPLMYNDQLNTVTYFARKGPGFTAYPHNNSGAIVAFVGQNGGTTWDSSAVWSSTLQYGRYPQGGIVNPFGNTLIAQAVLASNGPVQSMSGSWFGNYYASKSLSVVGTPSVGSDLQYMATNDPTYPVNKARHCFDRNNLFIPDDGRYRTIAGVLDDPSQPISNEKPRGIALVTGYFSAGAMVWNVDTFTPPVVLKTNNHKYLSSSGYQAWNEAGNIGYVVMMGIQANAYANNRGHQPVIWKTTNSGATWAQIPSIDFNTATFAHVVNSLSFSSGSSCLKKPYFMQNEGIACVVDANNRLHIYATIASSAYDSQQDSLFAIKQFTQGGNKYYWQFKPGFFPYIYDFYSDGTNDWNANIVDSVSTQGAGWNPGDLGYNENPWDSDPGNSNRKIPTGMRIQATRSADGQNIVISWAQSDTNFTSGGCKYNLLPNIMTRCYYTGSNKFSERQSITSGAGQSPFIASRAYNHFVSPVAQGTFAFGQTSFTLPVIVANSNPYSQNTDNRVYYTMAQRTYTMFNFSTLPTGTMCITGMSEPEMNSPLDIYPNPANETLYLRLTDFRPGTNLGITVSNVIGQTLISTRKVISATGELVELDTRQLPGGIYLLTIDAGGTKRTSRFLKN